MKEIQIASNWKNLTERGTGTEKLSERLIFTFICNIQSSHYDANGHGSNNHVYLSVLDLFLN
jgi:hypothetical protein